MFEFLFTVIGIYFVMMYFISVIIDESNVKTIKLFPAIICWLASISVIQFLLYIFKSF